MPVAFASKTDAAGTLLAKSVGPMRAADGVQAATATGNTSRVVVPVLLAVLALFIGASATPAAAAGATVRITGLQDVGLLSLDPGQDAINSQSICVYSDTATQGYSVTVYGSGAGSAYALSGGAIGGTLAYELQWNQSPGKTSGTQLSPGTALSGQVATATQQRCSNGPSSSASLIFILRSSRLQSATAGIAYTGTLTIIIAPQ